MTYLVLARKWRPNTWDDVVAQDHVTSTLRNAIQHNRLAHAYLFTGPRGVGKTSAARILAKALNCEKGPTPNPCNECSVCNEITEGRSVDVFEIDGASNRGIDEVRSLRENIRYTPAAGQYRIYIIDEVHMLTNEAFNALLKTLEEPPDHVIFIFATTEPRKVPATIVSRCQRFDFRRISMQDIIQSLKTICQSENISVEEEALLLIARKADGSLRDSQSILDQMVSYTEDTINAEDVIMALGLIEQEIFFEVTDIITIKDVSAGLVLVDRIVSEGYDLEEFMLGLAEHLRNFLLTQSLGSTELIEVSEEHKKRYQEKASEFKEEDLIRLIRLATDARLALKYSMNPRLPLELALVKMIKIDKTVTIEDLMTQLGQLKIPSVSNPKSFSENTARETKKVIQDSEMKEEKESSPADKKSEKKNDITLDFIKDRWDDAIQQIKRRKITVGSFLQEGILLDVKDNTLDIGFGLSNGFHIDAIMRAKNMVLEECREIFGNEFQFRCIKKDLPEKKKSASPKKKKSDLLNTWMKEEPLIKKVIDDFGAEMVD
jgi:DNA polymerase-3 subunit gamma/tau